MRGIGNRFVYVLRSDANPARHYVGITSNVDQRLEWHNHGPCGHTVNHRPWSVAVAIEFPDEQSAIRFRKRSEPCLPQAREKARLLCVHLTQRTNALGHLGTSALSFANLAQILKQGDRGVIVARALPDDERLDTPPRVALALR